MERPKRGLSAFDDIERLDQLGEVGKRPRAALIGRNRLQSRVRSPAGAARTWAT